jgi:hypothetical protein
VEGPCGSQLTSVTSIRGSFQQYLNLAMQEGREDPATPPTLSLCSQENLMLSILPKHVADEMLKDMKKDESQKDQQQFNTMYMYRHENVRCAGPEAQALTAGWVGTMHL